MSPRPRRSEQQPNLLENIKNIAWKQIAESGAASLSLRAIARELAITAPAIYNYYPSRDELVTALIVDAFNSLADAEEASLADLPAENFSARLSATGRAYRQWALSYPERYSLIFGTPISGYVAPAEITVPAAARGLAVVMDVLEAARQAGKLHIPAEYQTASPELLAQLNEWSAIQPGFDVRVLHFGLVVWSLVHGLVSLEIYGQFPPMVSSNEIFEIELQALVNKLIA